MFGILLGQLGEALVSKDLSFHFVLKRLGCKAGSIGLERCDRFLFIHDSYIIIVYLYRSRCKYTTLFLYRKRYFEKVHKISFIW